MTSSNGPSAAAPVPGGSPPVADREALPDRVWTLPNALSVLRLLGVPLFLWLLLGPQADGWALVVLVVSGLTDWLDGKLARWLDQGSRLGALLDPAADRLYIVSALIALALRGIVPVWLVALLLGRELVSAWPCSCCAGTAIRRCRCTTSARRPPCCCSTPSPGCLAYGSNPVAGLAEPIAWALTIWGTALYVLAGAFYLVQVAGIVQGERLAARSARQGTAP